MLKGLDVLLVEDQALIAMDAEDALLKLGATSVSSHPSVEEALSALAAKRPDFAVLDFNLDGDTTETIASELIAQHVPFVFVTGYGNSAIIPEKFRSVPIVSKPISLRELSEKVALAIVEPKA